MKKGYVELHCHSNFSLLDGASRIESLVDAARKLGMPALAITDHDGLYGVPAFYREAVSAGIQPVIGSELTLAGGLHITVLVSGMKGYGNLCRLITTARLSSPKGSAVLDPGALQGMTEGLICLSGCSRGPVYAFLKEGDRKRAMREGEALIDLFGRDNLYIELSHHRHYHDRALCHRLVDLAGRLNVETVATNNVHYACRDDAMLHDVLVCIGNRVTIDRSGPFRRGNFEYCLKGFDEMASLDGLPHDALCRTEEIARRCRFELDFSSYSFPDYPDRGEESAGAYLRRIVFERARQRYGDLPSEVSGRLDHELGLIDTKGLSGYFLIVFDVMEFARKASILAQGRGSAASSLVAYVLGITPVDPLRHRIFVGRFLNESAIPDIDVDIATNRRDEVIRYLYGKYGSDYTAMVCTYVTFQTRNAIREVGKVLGLPAHILDRMARSTSHYGGSAVVESLREVPEFRRYLDTEAWRHFCSLSAKIADFPRHLSIHTGGMIVSSRPLSGMVPLEPARSEGRVVCQWDKDGVDDAGFIKFDLLGLRMLAMIDEITVLVRKHRRIDLRYDDLPPDDQRVYDAIGRADTIGVFQVESRAQMQTLPGMKPQSLEDLAVEIAIIRPGPLQGDMVHPYIRRRQGREPVTYCHPSLIPVLGETMGVILFQEQIVQVACDTAGFTSGEANTLRKVLGRKNAEGELEKWRKRFIDGARAQGVDEEAAVGIFDQIRRFAGFGFCKSHAASFAILSYASAYFKVYYAPEFYCALLNNQPMGFYIPEVIVGDAKRHGVPVLPVDINRSDYGCTIEEGAVRVGFRYVRGVGGERVSRILAEREAGPFLSLRDFMGRAGLDRESVRNIIMAGAFDALHPSRRQLLWEAGTLDRPVFRGMTVNDGDQVPLDEMTWEEDVAAQYEIQGFSPHRQIVAVYREKLNGLGGVTSAGLARCVRGETVTVGGYCIVLQRPGTAKGFTFLTLEDEEGLINVVIRPDDYRRFRPLVRLEPLLLVRGVVERKGKTINVSAASIEPLR